MLIRHCSLVLLLLSLSALAQTSSTAAPPKPPRPDARLDEQKAALTKLKDMIGNWEGAGWIVTGPGQRSEFTQTEVVQSKLDGTLLTIEGEGRDKNDPAKVVHTAFAVLNYDPVRSQYKYMAYSGGRYLDLTPDVGDHGWRWGFDTPQGKIRYTLEFSSGAWREFGELSRDNGQTWVKNFEMILHRKP
jgi:hypothetical protein